MTPMSTPVTTPRDTPAVASFSTEHLVLDDLEPLEHPETLTPVSLTPVSLTPVSLAPVLPTPPELDAVSAPLEYAHASVGEHAPWEDQPLRDAVVTTDALLRTTPTSVAVVKAAPVVEPVSPPRRPDLDRGHTLALPTPGRGVVAVETPSRGQRVVAPEPPVRRTTPEPVRSVTPEPSAKPASAPARAVELPMILGTIATCIVAGGAVWWLLLR
jgi:hypothetical protein